jgi:hypothetical protein
MTLWLQMLAVCSWLLLVCAAPAGAQGAEGWDRYLDRHRGPYRGQVLEADTKTPLVGAVVVARWLRDHVYPLQVNAEPYAVRETTTDSEGRFVMEVREVEEGAPRRTRRPEFLIFARGYGVFPRRHKSPTGFLGNVFEGIGTTVELPRVEDREERLRNLSIVDPHGLSDRPHKDIPFLMRAIDEERIAIGLKPYPSPEKE